MNRSDLKFITGLVVIIVLIIGLSIRLETLSDVENLEAYWYTMIEPNIISEDGDHVMVDDGILSKDDIAEYNGLLYKAKNHSNTIFFSTPDPELKYVK